MFFSLTNRTPGSHPGNCLMNVSSFRSTTGGAAVDDDVLIMRYETGLFQKDEEMANDAWIKLSSARLADDF